MPITTLMVYADGKLDQTIELDPYDGNPIRHDADVTLNNADARWSVAVAKAPGSVPPILRHQVKGVSPAVWLKK